MLLLKRKIIASVHGGNSSRLLSNELTDKVAASNEISVVDSTIRNYDSRRRSNYKNRINSETSRRAVRF